MRKAPRLAWDSSCFIALINQQDTEDPAVLQALEATMECMIANTVRIVASKAIEVEVRPGTVQDTARFHQQLRAALSFESFAVGQSVQNLAQALADRVQDSGRKGGYADLIHVATAIAARASEFWTTDKKVIRWHENGVITEIRICRPYLEQGILDL